MRELDELAEFFRRAEQRLSAEEQNQIRQVLENTHDAFTSLETKYLDTIRDRAVVHSLLEKTSKDLLRRYQAIFEYSGTAMVVLDRDGTISLANSYFVTLTGYSRAEIEGRRKFSEFSDRPLNDLVGQFLLYDGDRDPDMQHYREGQLTDIHGKELIVVIRIGRFPETGQCVLSIIDITERKRAEEALRQANRKLNLLSGITRHDIKNQLLILTGNLQISTKFLNDPAKMAEFIEKEKKAAGTISHQISFTKDYEELGVKAPRWQNVAALVKRIIKGLPVRNIRIDTGDPTLEVFTDPLLEKVFYNLIDNALHYGGEQMTCIRISSQESESGLVISVEDDGAGIPSGDKTRLFTRGFGKNTGLGLFLSREILSITGCTLAETGEPGKGARFEIAVPMGQYRFIKNE